MTQGHQREGHLTLGIYIEQAVYRRVHKTADYLGGQAQGGGDGQQVGQQRAVVPAEMAIGAGLIRPGIAPVGAGAADGDRRVDDRRKGSDSSLAHFGWHARWLERWVDLERQGLVREVQEMRVGADAGIGMLGSFVVV